ncbi:MAG: hypothetical protein QG567_948 [Campylobacterota bacterium]|nr:hypothetical protein [Campylobacterota bacterium]
MTYRIIATTVTELCQTQESGTVNGVPTLHIMKKNKIEDGKLGRYPYYSGNSFRGIMHRVIADYVSKKIGVKLSATDYHLNYAGGGSNFQAQTIDTAQKARELNPIISVFGASLAIEGKLMVSNFEPVEKFWRETEKGFRFSGLVDTLQYTKKDDLISGSTVDRFTLVVSDEDKAEYVELNGEIQEARAEAREKIKSGGDAEKIKKASIQSFNKAECIIVGAELDGFIGEKAELTQVERGMLLKALELMMGEQLGGLRNKGYGVMSYAVKQESEGSVREVMNSVKNENDIFNPIVNTMFSKDEREALEAFEKWLAAATLENLEISKILS